MSWFRCRVQALGGGGDARLVPFVSLMCRTSAVPEAAKTTSCGFPCFTGAAIVSRFQRVREEGL